MHRGFNRRIESVSRPYHARVASVLHSRCPCQIRVKLSPYSYRIREHDKFSFPVNICPYYIRMASVSCPCHILVISACELRKDMTRTWYKYDEDNADATRTRHGGGTDLIRTFVRVNYFDCLKIIDTDKFGPGDRGGHDMEVIRIWTGRQGHDTDTCPCHVRVPIRVCVNVALFRREVINFLVRSL